MQMKCDSREFVQPCKLPSQNQKVIITCEGFRCLGFLDDDGIWRDAYSMKELADVKGWSYLDGNEVFPVGNAASHS